MQKGGLGLRLDLAARRDPRTAMLDRARLYNQGSRTHMPDRALSLPQLAGASPSPEPSGPGVAARSASSLRLPAIGGAGEGGGAGRQGERRKKRGKSGGKNLRLNVTSKFEMLEARVR